MAVLLVFALIKFNFPMRREDISLMKQQFVVTPHNSSDWDSRLTRQLG
jgi:hypothetical protein